MIGMFVFFFSSRRRHTRLQGDWSSDVCSSDLIRNWSQGRPGPDCRPAAATGGGDDREADAYPDAQGLAGHRPAGPPVRIWGGMATNLIATMPLRVAQRADRA